jgi:MerR family copper efflux transcriptional regulator
MDGLSVGRAAAHSGWSARMLRYLEHAGLVVPSRSASGYRLYGIRELNQLRGLADLRHRFGVELDEVAFALRLRREPTVRAALETWLAGTNVPTAGASAPEWVEWEQRKHEKLLVA